MGDKIEPKNGEAQALVGPLAQGNGVAPAPDQGKEQASQGGQAILAESSPSPLDDKSQQPEVPGSKQEQKPAGDDASSQKPSSPTRQSHQPAPVVVDDHPEDTTSERHEIMIRGVYSLQEEAEFQAKRAAETTTLDPNAPKVSRGLQAALDYASQVSLEYLAPAAPGGPQQLFLRAPPGDHLPLLPQGDNNMNAGGPLGNVIKKWRKRDVPGPSTDTLGRVNNTEDAWTAYTWATDYPPPAADNNKTDGGGDAPAATAQPLVPQVTTTVYPPPLSLAPQAAIHTSDDSKCNQQPQLPQLPQQPQHNHHHQQPQAASLVHYQPQPGTLAHAYSAAKLHFLIERARLLQHLHAVSSSSSPSYHPPSPATASIAAARAAELRCMRGVVAATRARAIDLWFRLHSPDRGLWTTDTGGRGNGWEAGLDLGGLEFLRGLEDV